MTDSEQRRIKISNHNWTKVTAIIMEYNYNKKTLDDSIEELVYARSAGGNDGQPHGNFMGCSKTENIAIKLNSNYINRLRREITAVEQALKYFNDEKRKVIKERYWMSRNSHPKPFNKIINCNYSEMQMRRICREMIILVAISLGYIEEQ